MIFRELFNGTPKGDIDDDARFAFNKPGLAGSFNISWLAFKGIFQSLFVSLTGNQTIAGVKTFTSGINIPILPTLDSEAVSKKYCDEIAGGGGSGVLERDVTVTRTGSGYPVGTVLATGTPLTDVIEGDLSPYITNAITGLTISFTGFSGTAEVGRELTVTQAAYTSSLDSASNPVQNIQISGIGFDSIIRTASPVAADLAPFIATRSTAGTITWTATGEDAKGAAKSRTATQTFQYLHGFGASATVVNSDITAQAVYDALQQKALAAGRARTVTATADNANVANRTIICYDASFGELTGIIQNGATPVLAAFNNLGAFNIVNQYGITRSFRFYASDAPGAFLIGTTLAIS